MKNIILRRAELDDMMLLYQWVNDPVVRENSFNPAIISLEEHQKWFNEKINNPNEAIFILLIDEQPVGQVRLSRNQDKMLISYSVASSYRGQGYGKLILKMVEDQINDEDIKLIGQVKKSNTASRLIFQSLGYREKEFDNYFEYLKIVNYKGDK